MLKIKDDMDLKELEKFGFNPRYNRDTGVLEEYSFKKSNLIINIKDRKIQPFRQYNSYCEIDLEYYNSDFVEEALCDLIKADLVEKVGD